VSARWTAVAAVAAFLAHEPLLVLLGRRGSRARREHERAAKRWLVVFGVVARVAGVFAFTLAPPGKRWALTMPLAPAAVVAATLGRDRERMLVGEVCTALTFSSCAGAMSLLSGASIADAVVIMTAFSVVFTAATLAVHVVVANNRRHTHVPPTTLRVSLVSLACVTLACMSVAVARGLTDATGIVAVTPGVGVAVLLAASPPSPVHLRRVGWLIVATAAVTTMVLIVGL